MKIVDQTMDYAVGCLLPAICLPITIQRGRFGVEMSYIFANLKALRSLNILNCPPIYNFVPVESNL